jgi:hypothetical protein
MRDNRLDARIEIIAIAREEIAVEMVREMWNCLRDDSFLTGPA